MRARCRLGAGEILDPLLRETPRAVRISPSFPAPPRDASFQNWWHNEVEHRLGLAFLTSDFFPSLHSIPDPKISAFLMLDLSVVPTQASTL